MSFYPLRIFIGVACALPLLADQRPPSAQENVLLRRIASYWEEGDTERAQRQILSYLEEHPRSAVRDSLHAMLGDLRLCGEQWQAALDAYQKIEDVDMRAKTRLGELRALFALGQYRRAASLAMENLQEAPLSAETRYIVAESLYRTALTVPQEQKKLWAEPAKTHYKLLEDTPFHDASLFPLARIHHMLCDFTQAISYYLASAERATEEAEESLFQAGCLQAGEDPEAAVHTFFRAVACAGKRAEASAFNILTLLFRSGSHARLAEAYPQLAKHLLEKQRDAAAFYLGSSYQALGEHEKAATLLLPLAASQKNPIPEHREELLFRAAALQFRQAHWDAASAAFTQFLAEFPQSSRAKAARKHLLYAVSRQTGNREALAAALRDFLEQDAEALSDERRHAERLLMRTLYELQRTHEAVSALRAYLNAWPDDGEAHLLLALSEQRLGHVDAFLASAQSALASDLDPENKHYLHTQLYNHYLAKSEYAQAAEHLFQCYLLSPATIKRDNQVWLAHYLYRHDAHKERARRILSDIVRAAPLSPSTEAEALMLVELSESSQERLSILEALEAARQADDTQHWGQKQRSWFELATLYGKMGRQQDALRVYDTLALSFPSFFTKAALLERARLHYALLTDRSPESPALDGVLNAFKDLQVQRHPLSEPIHLEAAIDYACVRSELAPDAAKEAVLRQLLQKAREEFDSSEEYRITLRHFPEKEPLVRLYLRFMDAELLRLSAAPREDVKHAFHQLLAEEESLTPYLKTKIASRMESL
jgi:TolA-binding protein